MAKEELIEVAKSIWVNFGERAVRLNALGL